MDVITPSLPEPKIVILENVKLRESEKKKKKENPCKYLDQLFKTDAFLEEYFEEK
jgi:3-phosphoglycerate kinase